MINDIKKKQITTLQRCINAGATCAYANHVFAYNATVTTA